MKKQRNLIIALAVVLLAALVLAISTMGQDNNRPPMEEKPTLVMDKLIPLGTPEAEFKEVAILPLMITWEEGNEETPFRVERVSEAYIQRSYAPNVFNLQGPIELNLLGEENISWALVDPRPEVENERANEEGAEDEPLHREAEGINQFQWEVVVPLYRDDKSFNAEALTITYEGEVIFETEINYDEWRKRGEDRRNNDDNQQEEQRPEG